VDYEAEEVERDIGMIETDGFVTVRHKRKNSGECEVRNKIHDLKVPPGLAEANPFAALIAD
jgi:hypothetical protein